MNDYTPQDDATLGRLYATTSNPELARILGRTLHSVKSRAKKLKLRKSPQRISECQRTAIEAAARNKTAARLRRQMLCSASANDVFSWASAA